MYKLLSVYFKKLQTSLEKRYNNVNFVLFSFQFTF